MKLSVIIPVYNQEVLVRRALESVPAACQLIVIDDGSTDNTMRTLLEFQNIRPDTEVLYNFKNMGVIHTVNKGLDAATGDYVVLLGSDDYLITPEFERLMDEMDGTDLIYFDLRINDGSIFHLTPQSKNTFCGSVKLMRREFVGNTRNPEEKRKCEDWFFYQELLRKNPTEKYTNIVAKHYNFPREGSLTNTKEEDLHYE